MARRGWRLGAAAAVTVVVAFCASGPERPGLVRTASDLGPLPADRYAYTPQDHQRSQRASALLVRQCMADRGHPDFPLDPRYPTDPFVAVAVGTDYGVLDLDAARRWGYGWDPAQHPVPRPTGRRMTDAEYADWPACNAEAERQLTHGIDVKRDWLYAGRRAIEVDKAVKRDPRLRAAWNQWSRCVAAQGFARYPDPVAAYTDHAWQRTTAATPGTRSGSGPPPSRTSPASAATTRPKSGTPYRPGSRLRTSPAIATATPPDFGHCTPTEPTSPKCCGNSASCGQAFRRLPAPALTYDESAPYDHAWH
ncbi:hypothetical protein AB0D42_08170 [Streptomyces sp. NPDC048304]|uniref:hypothetical protein n=1 Tax=Streptomyces sp. NPDC048304 TaxID=3154820 RepID=UPI003409E4BB